MENFSLKYNIPAPRYTSYPTVPYWDNTPPSEEEWKAKAQQSFWATNDEEGISIYIHLPFCENLCTYCGCNTRITKNHGVEIPYLVAVLKEWSLYLELFEGTPRIKELHLGGGTPTFFSPQNLRNLVEGILSTSTVTKDALFGFEAHPNNTSCEQLKTLASLGFTRISIGVQDFDEKVQQVINRKQSFHDVLQVTANARKFGFTSVNYDLVFGLPLQTMESMKKTINMVLKLKPDRIAFYSYAHVPWLKKAQRKFTESDLPDPVTKLSLYEQGKSELERNGYVDIGMDHFALTSDSLFKAKENKTLHRNFMGYNTSKPGLLIGLGVSAISDSLDAFVQNERTVEKYYQRVQSGKFPFFKGHLLSRSDLVVRMHIDNILCKMETSWQNKADQCDELNLAKSDLHDLEKDGLISIGDQWLKVTNQGKPFLRIVCKALDYKLREVKDLSNCFSQAI